MYNKDEPRNLKCVVFIFNTKFVWDIEWRFGQEDNLRCKTIFCKPKWTKDFGVWFLIRTKKKRSVGVILK